METGRIEGMRELSALVAFVFVLFCAGTTVAMPSQKELSEAQPIVNELMGPFAKDYKAKKKTAAEVGDRAMEFVAEANTQAAKFVLLKGAVHYYALAKEYDKAADAIESIMKLVPDLPPKALYEITSKAVSSVTAKTAPRLFDLNKSAKDRMTVATRLKAIEKDLRSTPADLKLVRMHAELTAAAGNWDEALEEFAKLGGAIGQMAKAESESTGTSAELADFWWSYKPTVSEAKDSIRKHSASFYRKAMDNGELDGLKKAVAEKRIAEMESQSPGTNAAMSLSHGSNCRDDYMIVDLDSGKVTFEGMALQHAANRKYNTNEYKTKKMVFRKIKAGVYTIGHNDSSINPLHICKLPQDFCIRIFPCTRDQYVRLTGGTPNGDVRPQTEISWDVIRGSAGITSTPATGVMANLNAKTQAAGFAVGSGFDLPTISMFEIAGRAGMTTRFPWGDDPSVHHQYGWWKGLSGYNKDGIAKLPKVGQKKPNNWGIFDVVGLVHYFCRDVSPGKGLTCASFAAQNANALLPNVTGDNRRRVFSSSDTTYAHDFGPENPACFFSTHWCSDTAETKMPWVGFRIAWHE